MPPKRHIMGLFKSEDKVVAAPVVMRVGHMPVFALPFYYKSLKQGRQSGILFPNFEFGWSERDGRHIGNIKIGPVHSYHRRARIGLLIGEKEFWNRGYATEAIKLAARSSEQGKRS